MKHFIMYILLLTSFQSTNIEVGMVRVTLEPNSKVIFYRSPSSSSIQEKYIQSVFDTTTNINRLKDADSVRKWLKPELIDFDEYQLAFRCKQKVGEWFEVIVNQETGKSLWLHSDAKIKFLEWMDFFNFFTIERIDPQKNPIFCKPNIYSKEVIYTDGDCFKIRTMDGDWIEIYSPSIANSYGVKTPISSGWIKWREGEKLLVHFNYKD